MTLGINIPPTPSAGNSPNSDGSSNPPRTPNSPNMQTVNIASELPTANNNNSNNITGNVANTQMKRKPSRRANTAERRATHNAVERQRRETLNGRFLDLAALLPNLSQIRRPSKSSIVNSSIAYVHASRRHRQLASRELRLLKLEADALRRELNEWRDRSRLPHVEEPVRGDGFTMVLSGEIEVLSGLPEEEEDNSAHGYDGYDDGEEDYIGGGGVVGVEEERNNAVAMINNVSANPFAHNLAAAAVANNAAAAVAAHAVLSGQPMIVSSPTTVSFENPAMASLYEPTTATATQNGFNYLQQQQAHQLTQQDVEKWNSQMFSTTTSGTGSSLFTPPTSAHGLSTPSGTPPAGFNDSATHFFANLQKQQQQQMAMTGGGHVYASPEADDRSSIGSAGMGSGRERRGSFSNGSATSGGAGSGGYITPPHTSPPTTASFDFTSANVAAAANVADFANAIKRSSISGLGGLSISTGGGYGASGASVGVDGMGGWKQASLGTPISVGGGGNNGGFAMMMM